MCEYFPATYYLVGKCLLSCKFPGSQWQVSWNCWQQIDSVIRFYYFFKTQRMSGAVCLNEWDWNQFVLDVNRDDPENIKVHLSLSIQTGSLSLQLSTSQKNQNMCIFQCFCTSLLVSTESQTGGLLSALICLIGPLDACACVFFLDEEGSECDLLRNTQACYANLCFPA